MDEKTGKIAQGIEVCIMNDYLGFVASLKAVWDN